jgi:hypothetical protein
MVKINLSTATMLLTYFILLLYIFVLLLTLRRSDRLKFMPGGVVGDPTCVRMSNNLKEALGVRGFLAMKPTVRLTLNI